MSKKRFFLVFGASVLVSFAVSKTLTTHSLPFLPRTWLIYSLSLSTLLFVGINYSPALFLGIFLGLINNSTSLITNGIESFGLVLGSTLSTYLINTFSKGKDSLKDMRGIWKFILIGGFFGALLSSSFLVIAFPNDDWFKRWLLFTGESVLVVPFILSLFTTKLFKPTIIWIAKSILVFILTLLISLVVFTNLLPSEFTMTNFSLLLILPVLIASFAFGQTGASIYSFIMYIVVIASIISGISVGSINEDALFVPTLTLGIISTTGLIIGSSLSARKKLDSERMQFVSIAAHDLRTPLTSMRWGLDALLNLKNYEAYSSVKTKIRALNQINLHMIDLVNELLEANRIVQGRSQNNPHPTDITPLLYKEVDKLNGLTEEKGIKMIIKPSFKPLPKVNVDPNRFAFVLQNLVANAIKFNIENGSINISTQFKENKIYLVISDTGIGIPNTDKSKVFSKFFRASNAKDKGIQGTGLGLFIVKSYIDAWGGNIWFDSPTQEDGTGTTFYITLPASISG